MSEPNVTGLIWAALPYVVIGLLIHTAKDFQAARMNKVKLSPKVYITGAWLEIGIATLVAVGVWGALPEIAQAFPEAKALGVTAEYPKLSGIIIGYLSNSLLGSLGGRARLVAGA